MPLDFTKGSVSQDFAEKVTPGALAEDVEGDTLSAIATDADTGNDDHIKSNVAADAELSLALKNLNFDASSIAFSAGFACAAGNAGNIFKLRLYMGGLQMQESAFLENQSPALTYVLRDFKALSGSQNCELKAHNSSGGFVTLWLYGGNGPVAAAIAVGSVKLV